MPTEPPPPWGPPKDYTKPRQTIQSPDRQYKAPRDNTKPQKTIQSPRNTTQRPKILDKTFKKACKTQTY